MKQTDKVSITFILGNGFPQKPDIISDSFNVSECSSFVISGSGLLDCFGKIDFLLERQFSF